MKPDPAGNAAQHQEGEIKMKIYKPIIYKIWILGKIKTRIEIFKIDVKTIILKREIKKLEKEGVKNKKRLNEIFNEQKKILEDSGYNFN